VYAADDWTAIRCLQDKLGLAETCLVKGLMFDAHIWIANTAELANKSDDMQHPLVSSSKLGGWLFLAKIPLFCSRLAGTLALTTCRYDYPCRPPKALGAGTFTDTCLRNTDPRLTRRRRIGATAAVTSVGARTTC